MSLADRGWELIAAEALQGRRPGAFRVSPDVWDELKHLAPGPSGQPWILEARFWGIPLSVDWELPPDSMVLDP